jgi:hypothetical protein
MGPGEHRPQDEEYSQRPWARTLFGDPFEAICRSISPSAMFAEQMLRAGVDLGSGDFEGVSDLENVGERDVTLPTLYIPVIAAVEAALEGEPFLDDAAFLAQIPERVAERSVGWR